MHRYEVEIKSLLGSEENAVKLREKMILADPHTKIISTSKQYTHYFQGGNLEALAESVLHRCLTEEKCIQFSDIAKQAKHFSVRTRQKNNDVFLIVKMTLDDKQTITHAASRIEFEEKVNIPLDALDALILGSGFVYQAKWSRDREEYSFRGLIVCLDRNAGYGWLAEFEKMVDTEAETEAARREVLAVMREVGAEEIQHDQLERMFSFYNAHWQEYYGTDKVFTIT